MQLFRSFMQFLIRVMSFLWGFLPKPVHAWRERIRLNMCLIDSQIGQFCKKDHGSNNSWFKKRFRKRQTSKIWTTCMAACIAVFLLSCFGTASATLTIGRGTGPRRSWELRVLEKFLDPKSWGFYHLIQVCHLQFRRISAFCTGEAALVLHPWPFCPGSVWTYYCHLTEWIWARDVAFCRISEDNTRISANHAMTTL